jgi:GntR family transcriptional regulator
MAECVARLFDKDGNMCHSTDMTLFRLSLRPGESIFDQLVFAAKKAFVSGELETGQAFPSVRTLAAEFKIHPNTAHKVVQHLIQERWLEARPGIGTVVAEIPEPRRGDRKRLLGREVEQLVVEAQRLELDIDEVIEALEDQWARLKMPEEVSRK